MKIARTAVAWSLALLVVAPAGTAFAAEDTLTPRQELRQALTRLEAVAEQVPAAYQADVAEVVAKVKADVWDAVDRAGGVRASCLSDMVNRIGNTFQSIYYYWIHYPWYGIAETLSAVEGFISCQVPPE